MSSSVLLMAVLGVGLCVVGCSGGDESHTEMEEREWRGLVVRREDGGDEGEGAVGGGECPTWTLPARNESNTCLCGDSLRSNVRCDPHSLNVSIQDGYCMSHDHNQNTTYAAQCPYGLKHHSNQKTTFPYLTMFLN